MNFFHLRVYRRLILSVLLVVAVFILIGFWGLNSNRNAMRTEIEKDVWSSSNYYVSQMETEFETLIGLQSNFAVNKDLMELIVAKDIMTPYQFTEKVKNVSNQLINIKHLYTLVENAMIFIPEQNSIIAATPPFFDDAKDEIWLNHKGAGILSSGDGNIYLVSYFPTIYQSCIQITGRRLATTLKSMNQHENGIVILVDRDRQVLATVGNQEGTLIEDCLNAFEESNTNGEYEGSFEFKSDKKRIGVYSISSTQGFGVIYTVPTDAIYEPLEVYNIQFFALALLSVALLVAYARFIKKIFLRPMTLILDAFEKTSTFDNKIEGHDTDEFTYLYTQYNNMIDRMDRLIREVYESKYRLSMAQFKQLQYQIRPHFLYNSIYTVYRMAKYDGNDGIASFVLHLSKYYEYIAKLNMDKVPLSDEVGHVVDYLKIQEMRFNNRIKLIIGEIPEGIESKEVIPLVLHPLVENVFEHAIHSAEDKAEISVTFDCKDEVFSMEVRDNGLGMDEDKLSKLQKSFISEEIPAEIHGLINTNYRLKISYGAKSGIIVKNLEKKGFSAKVIIDFSAKELNEENDV